MMLRDISPRASAATPALTLRHVDTPHAAMRHMPLLPCCRAPYAATYADTPCLLLMPLRRAMPYAAA